MIAELFTAFDPQLKVLPAEGKFMASDKPELENLKECDFISVYTETLEDNALLVMNNRQVMATIKGVSDNFDEQADIDKILYGGGIFQLHVDVIDYGVLGINLLMQLGVGTDFASPIQVYAPRKGKNINLNDPRESFNEEELYSPKVGFMVKQSKYDSNYAITSLAFARRLFERQGYVSAVELKLTEGMDVEDAKKEIRNLLGKKYKVLDRYEQQEDTFKIMKIEKLISYIFLTFILLVACFNIIGSLSMLVVDKKKDVQTLRNLGADDGQIANIFLIEGRMIAVIGAVAGIVIGLALCLVQQNFGVIKFGSSAGNYIIDAYPVSVHVADIIVVFITVLVVGFLSVWYPIRYLSRKFTAE